MPLHKMHLTPVTSKQKELVFLDHSCAMASGPGIEYPYPCPSWTEEDAFRMIKHCDNAFNWNITYTRGVFYNVTYKEIKSGTVLR